MMIPETPRHARNQRPVAPCHLGVHLCAKALSLFLQLQHSSLLWGIASGWLGLIQSSRMSRMHSTDAQVSELLTPSVWCLNTKHVMGWDEDASRASWQTNSFENMVSFFIVLLLPRRINWLRLVTYRGINWILEGRPQCQITFRM